MERVKKQIPQIGRRRVSDKAAADEVACQDCGMDPMCSILEYAEEGSNVPEGVLLRRRHVARGETIFLKDDPFRSVFAVKSGSFKTYIPKVSGYDQVVGFHLIGELVGMEGLSGQRYPYTARALQDSSVCELRMESLSESGYLLEDLQQGIINMLSAEVAFNHQLITTLIHQSADQRLAGFLLNLTKRLHARGMRQIEFQIGMSRSDIGSYLGLASETVSRVFTRFQKNGLIQLRHKRLRLLDQDGLRDIAEH
ncbi:helix-turn-helix domain-containing protein [Sedimenticola selenatireducens]|uniref:helix-turn-helix domain-containing protein n=1 Tax=Sedimenticola selenatireducens TaxID=191960 RepID=UPI0009FF5FE7|nr:helix-turn-helix domain-containing protein [Sedimenticola selenatireducens]